MVKNTVLLVILTFAGHLAQAEIVDPTRPVGSSPRASHNAQSLQLESVLFSDNRQVAIINGSVVAVGDRIADGRVERIDENGVSIDFQGSTKVLMLPNTEVKRASKKP